MSEHDGRLTLLEFLARIHPEMWDAIHPHSPREIEPRPTPWHEIDRQAVRATRAVAAAAVAATWTGGSPEAVVRAAFSGDPDDGPCPTPFEVVLPPIPWFHPDPPPRPDESSIEDRIRSVVVLTLVDEARGLRSGAAREALLDQAAALIGV